MSWLKSQSLCVIRLFTVAGSLVAGRIACGHSDVEFSYVNEKIEVELSSEGVLVFESEFPLAGLERQFTSEPGFISETAEGLGIGSNETIVYNVLSGLMVWDGANLSSAPAGVQLRTNHLVPNVPDTIIAGDSNLQPGVISITPADTRNLVGISDGVGNFHFDLNWFLEPNLGPALPPPPAFGAYGILLSLSTSAGGIADSEPFALVFNFGLATDAFEAAIDEFSHLVPEGSTLGGWWAVGVVNLLSRCRRTANDPTDNPLLFEKRS